ncbi:MAG: chromosome segregation protein SMC [Acidobacteria bacterium]|nr:chromosome segregation protein SMC [Acidobacteriota bacterium]MBI3424194.1 chromosome segregation protein SMC [Acidobacteriota bacterium]
MLRFEKLFIQGFKSFCDPTEVVFDEHGITAVVGPNGCGKSNVADAISWVIGEQRAKSLRGGKMEDVIFTGSRNRQPSGMAEVMLTMVVTATFEIRSDIGKPSSEDVNEALSAKAEREHAADIATHATEQSVDETLESGAASIEAPTGEAPLLAEATPAEAESAAEKKKQAKPRKVASKETARLYHEGERITVGRRLYRTGESEYEMNGRACRLRDIQDLFSGTGLGGAHYAIIEQGRIGQVLSAKPLDRRSLIEEAAGVAKFKMRQHQAELKLDATRTNLARVTDILLEVERQQNSLKRQAQKARRYQRLRQESRDLMRAVFVVDYRTMRNSSGALATRLAEIAARETETAAQIAAQEEAQALAAQQARAAEDALNATRQEASAIDLEVERAKQQHAYLTQQLQSLGQRSQQFARDQAAISERNDFITQEAARLRTQLSTVEQEINAESKALLDAEAEHRALADRDSGAEGKLEDARKQLYENTTTLERWRQLKRQFTEAVERAQTRLQGLATERERAVTQAQAAEERSAELRLKFEETTLQQQNTAEELSNVTAQLNQHRQTRETKQAALNALQRNLTTAEQRLKSLQELDERRTYFSEAVQLLMQNQQPGFRTLGTLADFVQVAPEFETVIEAGLRDELQYVVVPSYEDAINAIEFLKAEGGGRATFLVVGNHTESSAPPSANGHEANGHRTLNSLLGLRPDYAEAFKLALPGLAQAKIVDDTAQAIELARQAATNNNGSGAALVSLTRSGERIIAGRLVTGGSGSEKGTGVLALKREIVALDEQLDTLSEQVNAAETELRELNQLINHLTERRNALDAELRQLEKRLAVEREQLQQAERERERTSTYIRVVETETAQAQEELADFDRKLQQAATQTSETEQAHAAANEVVAAAQNELAELRRLAEQRTQELSRRRAEFAAKTERRRGMQNDLRRLENETSDLSNRLDRTRLEAVEADEQANQLSASIENIAEQSTELLAEQTRFNAELTERSQIMNAAREQVETLDLQLRAARDAATQAREERAQREIERAKLSSDLEHLSTLCYNELGEQIGEVVERLEQAGQQGEGEDSAAETEAAPTLISLTLDGDDEEGESQTDAWPTFWTVPEDFDLVVAKARLDELRAKIEALGPVNMMALQELGEIEERFVFLTTQKADIEKAMADTLAAITEIKHRSRERFRDAFTQINENFKQMFVELFGGGQGEMRLIDESDILESGIEIIAQPPGKRLQNVLLLSGGEKAMTAIALVMGIFKYRPSPFCLLDEVDAPLDEMNIGRFSDKIMEMSQFTQFMVITHSKRTMEVARTLYGVTMEDPGVSKLISVKLA